MSAINDALRRASTGKSPGESPRAGSPPLPNMPLSLPPLPSGSISTALPPRIDEMGLRSSSPALAYASRQPRSITPIVFGIGAFLCVFVAAGSYWYAKQHGPMVGGSSAFGKAMEEESSGIEEIAIAEMEKTASPTVAVPVTPTAPVTTPAPKPVTSQQGSPWPTVIASKPPPASANNGSVKFPPLRLQTIYYRPANPSVMINGKILFVSDEVGGVTVADISPSSVTLVLSGQTNILTLR